MSASESEETAQENGIGKFFRTMRSSYTVAERNADTQAAIDGAAADLAAGPDNAMFPVTGETCDRCGPAVAAKFSWRGLTWCGHCASRIAQGGAR